MKYFQKRGLFNTKNTLTFIVINLKKKNVAFRSRLFFQQIFRGSIFRPKLLEMRSEELAGAMESEITI